MHLISLLGLSAFLARSVFASPAPNKAILSCEVDLASESFHQHQYQLKTAVVNDQVLPDGVYQMSLINFMVSAPSSNPGTLLQLLPPGALNQKSKYNSDAGTYTFQLVSSGSFITSQYIRPASPVQLGDPMEFLLLPAGPPDELMFFVSPPGNGPPISISPSPIKIFPPMVALMPIGNDGIVTFRPAS